MFIVVVTSFTFYVCSDRKAFENSNIMPIPLDEIPLRFKEFLVCLLLILSTAATANIFLIIIISSYLL